MSLKLGEFIRSGEGSEMGKTRRGVVISNNINNEFADNVTVPPIASSTEKIDPFEIFISKNIAYKASDSKAKANQIRIVDNSTF